MPFKVPKLDVYMRHLSQIYFTYALCTFLQFSPLYLVSFSFILIGLVIYNTRIAPTAGKEQSPFTVIYWKSYCNSLLCECRCICQRSDPESSPLLSVTEHNDNISNYNTVKTDELNTPSPKDAIHEPTYVNSQNDATSLAS